MILKIFNFEDEIYLQYVFFCDDNSIQGNLESFIFVMLNLMSMVMDMEKWINVEFGYLELLDEVCDFLELLMQLGLVNCLLLDCIIFQSFFDKYILIVNFFFSDNEDFIFYDFKLWCFN